MIEVSAVHHVTDIAALAPKFTLVAPVKLVPVMLYHSGARRGAIVPEIPWLRSGRSKISELIGGAGRAGVPLGVVDRYTFDDMPALPAGEVARRPKSRCSPSP